MNLASRSCDMFYRNMDFKNSDPIRQYNQLITSDRKDLHQPTRSNPPIETSSPKQVPLLQDNVYGSEQCFHKRQPDEDMVQSSPFSALTSATSHHGLSFINIQSKNINDHFSRYPVYVVPSLHASNLNTPLQIRNEDTSGMQIRVLGVPQTGAKSRVETQIKLCIQLVTDDGRKTQQWSHLKLSQDMVTKGKLKRQTQLTVNTDGHGSIISVNGIENSQTPVMVNKMLFLGARVVCASDPSRDVTACPGCVQRELKRSKRRKGNMTSDMTDTDRRILLFNCPEIADFSSGDTILPTRITCYCRHHNEHLGFCIYFEMHDYKGNTVASGMSPPIMITDDHKSNKGRNRKLTHKRGADRDDNTLASPVETDGTLSPISPHKHYKTTPNIHIHQVIPSQGPVEGGIQVTILGSGFIPGQTCFFGNVAAEKTYYWSPSTMVCVLPPAVDTGTVFVSICDNTKSSLFTYCDGNDQALMELALQVVGMKMTGKVGDARDIATLIIKGSRIPSLDQCLKCIA